MIMMLTRPKQQCPRCAGHLIRTEGEDSCLNCGWLDIDLPEIPADIETLARRAARPGGYSRRRIKPAVKGYYGGRPGMCINGHGYRALAHRNCMAERVREAVLA